MDLWSPCGAHVESVGEGKVQGTVPQTETSNSAKVVLNPPVQAFLPDTIITPQKEAMSSDNCFLKPL